MTRPIQLHVDLAVDPAKEADMVRYSKRCIVRLR